METKRNGGKREIQQLAFKSQQENNGSMNTNGRWRQKPSGHNETDDTLETSVAITTVAEKFVGTPLVRGNRRIANGLTSENRGGEPRKPRAERRADRERDRERGDKKEKWDRNDKRDKKDGKRGNRSSREGQQEINDKPKRERKGEKDRERERERKPRESRDKEAKKKNGRGGAKPEAKKEKRRKRDRYPAYMEETDVTRRLQEGTLVQGVLRINASRRCEAYVTVGGASVDILIDGELYRNRALEGDIVVVEVCDKSKWRKKKSHKNESTKAQSEEEELEHLDDVVIPDDVNIDDVDEDNSFGISEKCIATTPTITTLTTQHVENDCEQAHSRLALTEYLEAHDINPTACNNSSGGSFAEVHSATSENIDSASDDNNSSIDNSDNESEDIVVFSGIPNQLQANISFDNLDHHQRNVLLMNEEEQAATAIVTNNLLDMLSKINLDDDEAAQPTGKVVFILEAKHQPTHAGYLRTCHDDNKVQPKDRFAAFTPMDKRYPRMIVPLRTCPPDFTSNPARYEKTLFITKLVNWSPGAQIPLGKIVRILGESGNLETETDAILIENGVNTKDFSPAALRCLKKFEKFSAEFDIPKKELKKRKDFRQDRVFTIDPATARDLDDALHIKYLGNGVYEIGVHIADVSHFVEINKPLDMEARIRGNTVYLVDYAIPMLPRLLSENLCSLNPNVDRCAFSVVWRMNKNGEILEDNEHGKVWFGKSVIRSSHRFSYEEVQRVLDGEKADYPRVIIQDMKLMHQIAMARRRQRFASGAMSVHRPKVTFIRDSENRIVDFGLYKLGESNQLVEEYMLMANYLVARQLAMKVPEYALLRNHPAPKLTKLKTFAKTCAKLGITINPEEFKFSDLRHLVNAEGANLKYDKEHVYHVLNYFATRTLQNAKYFVAGAPNTPPTLPSHQHIPVDFIKDDNWFHYALNMPCYTHFTSPIRRYSDLMVHRLLQWTIEKENEEVQQLEQNKKRAKQNWRRFLKRGNNGNNGDADENQSNNSYEEHHAAEDLSTQITPEDLEEICNIANQKKYCAKKAQEQTEEIYLCELLERFKHPVEEEGVVMGVGDNWLSVLIPRLGIEQHVYLQDQKEIYKTVQDYTVTNTSNNQDGDANVVVAWADPNKGSAVLTFMSSVKVRFATKRGRMLMELGFVLLPK